MTYLLDTMIVAHFQQVGHETRLSAAAKHCAMAVVGEVRGELYANSKYGGQRFETWFAAANIGERSIEVGSKASDTLTQLMNPSNPSKDLGERASIALAAHDQSLTFVTQDKGGMWLAFRELWMPGERVLGLAVFLRRLFENGALTETAVLDEIMGAMGNTPRPTWWASWRAGLPTARH